MSSSKGWDESDQNALNRIEQIKVFASLFLFSSSGKNNELK